MENPERATANTLSAYLEKLSSLYFWPIPEKTRFIADACFAIFAMSAASAWFVSQPWASDQTLSVTAVNLPWTIIICTISAGIFVLLRFLSSVFAGSEYFSHLILMATLLAIAICFPFFFSIIGVFDGLCWAILFIYAAVGFVLIETKYVFRTMTSMLLVLMLISFFSHVLPYEVMAYGMESAFITSLETSELAFRWFVMGVVSLISLAVLGYLTGAMQRREYDLRNLSYKDELTGLRNRRSVLEGLEIEFQIAVEDDAQLSLIMLDLDFFKKINDNYGHQFGDKVLKVFSEKVKKICRSHDLLGRYGGEEFLIIFPDCPEIKALTILNRLRNILLSEPVSTEQGELVTIRFSAGVAQLNKYDKDSKSLIERADVALYKAKAQGRNRVLVAQEKLEP